MFEEVGQMKIISDSREQILIFKESTIMKLNVGDITTQKLKDSFIIERKSLEDLYGTLVQGHIRFRKEIIRAQEQNISLPIYCEGSYEDFINKRFAQGYKRKMRSETLARIISSMEKKYKLEFVWCHGRENMKFQIKKRFEEEEAKLSPLQNKTLTDGVK